MAIYPQSRYALGTVTRMPDESGTYQQAVLRTVPQAAQNFNLYIWRQGDRPDAVAQALLGNGQLWWSIIDANPELIDPLNIPAGSAIRVPTGPIMGQGTLIQ